MQPIELHCIIDPASLIIGMAFTLTVTFLTFHVTNHRHLKATRRKPSKPNTRRNTDRSVKL